MSGNEPTRTGEIEQVRRLANEAIDNQLAYYSGGVALDAETFYGPVLKLVTEYERLRGGLAGVDQAMLAAGVDPQKRGFVLDQIEGGDWAALTGSSTPASEETP